MAGSERGSMEDLRGQIFTVLGTYEVNKMILLIVHSNNIHQCIIHC